MSENPYTMNSLGPVWQQGYDAGQAALQNQLERMPCGHRRCDWVVADEHRGKTYVTSQGIPKEWYVCLSCRAVQEAVEAAQAETTEYCAVVADGMDRSVALAIRHAAHDKEWWMRKLSDSNANNLARIAELEAKGDALKRELEVAQAAIMEMRQAIEIAISDFASMNQIISKGGALKFPVHPYTQTPAHLQEVIDHLAAKSALEVKPLDRILKGRTAKIDPQDIGAPMLRDDK